MSYCRSVTFSIAAIAIAMAPGKAVWGAEPPSRKLDNELQNAIADGCSSGPRNVIITDKDGYRSGMSKTLKALVDKVKAEFRSINAVAAVFHCDDLIALAR